MAELAIGVVALAGLFNNAVDCFEYVQLGRTFGRDFQTCQLKLDCARLRLSRWGASIGINGDVNEQQSLQGLLSAPAAEVKSAKEILDQIIELFKDAQQKATKLSLRKQSNNAGQQTDSTGLVWSPTHLSLHERLGAMSIRRQNKTSLWHKVGWGLHGQREFGRLLEDLKSLLDDLVLLFPQAENSRQALSQEEVTEVPQETLPLLIEAARGQDDDLEKAIQNVYHEREAAHNVVISGYNDRGLQVGVNHGTMNGTWN